MLVMLSLGAAGQTGEVIKTSSITGRVVNESGQPLPNASVSAQAVGSRERSETATDREGVFKLSGLKPVPYTVSAYMAAYISPSMELESGSPKQYKVGDSVTLVLIKGGVITGTVTTAAGDPVVRIGVWARMIGNDKNKGPIAGGMVRESLTDDRGVYRIYGLPTGTYIVGAGASRNYTYSEGSAFDTLLPTYAPSSIRDTAAEITVRAGEETANIDIRYRGEPGRTISGVARGLQVDENFGLAVHLTSIEAGSSQSDLSYFQRSERAGFVFFGIADGDYYLTAQANGRTGEREISEPKLIKVRGADIEGIELTTSPMASITGRVVLEDSKATECSEKDRPRFSETFISAWHRQTEATKTQPQILWNFGAPVPADAQGNITLRNLAPSQYYFAARFSAKSWYLQSISFAPAAAKTGKPIDAARNWITVKTGDKLSGLTVTLAQGAASLNGQIALREGESLPEKMFVYLVPAEKEKADDLLRFYGAAVGPDGKIAMNSIAPGRYWVVAQPANDEANSPVRKLRSPDAAETRTRLRRDAEAAKTEIELKPCQSSSLTVKYF
jgi:hypothetical protein